MPKQDMDSHPFTIYDTSDATTALCLWASRVNATACRAGRTHPCHSEWEIEYLETKPVTVEVDSPGIGVRPAAFGGGSGGSAGHGARITYFCNVGDCDFSDGDSGNVLEHRRAVHDYSAKPMLKQEAPSEAELAFRAHADATAALVREKDKSYGGAWQKQGYMGNLARVMSKAARLENMMWCDKADGEYDREAEEPALETLHDLMALCAFMASNLEEGNRWGH